MKKCFSLWKCCRAKSNSKYSVKVIEVRKTGGFYFLGFIGAAVYYISNAVGFWGIVLALLKAAVWPAFLVFGLLNFLG